MILTPKHVAQILTDEIMDEEYIDAGELFLFLEGDEAPPQLVALLERVTQRLNALVNT